MLKEREFLFINNEKTMEEQLKEYRVQLDGLLRLAENLEETEPHSWEMISLPIALKFAKAYVGKVLGSRGIATPYKNDGKRKDVTDIEPTDAVSNMHFKVEDEKYWGKDFNKLNSIEKVDWLREEIQKIITNLESLFDTRPVVSRHEAIYRTQVFVNLTDARLWLGFELERIREENERARNKSTDVKDKA